jgi:hypothetical protein
MTDAAPSTKDVRKGTPIDLAKLRSLAVLSRRTGAQIQEARRSDGVRVKATTDELGNTTVEHATRDDRVDVHIAAPHIRVEAKQREIRQ